jgi:hypothetical protein
MTGQFTLKTSKGDVLLKVTKLCFYNFEKQRGQGLITSFADVRGDGSVRIKAAEVLNWDIQIDLARMAQIETQYTSEELLEIADPDSLMQFVMFAITEYVDMRGLDKGKKRKPEKNS